MTIPTREELVQSIEELCAYRDRLQNEVLMMSRKLKMPQNKVETSIKEHDELKKIDKVISILKEQVESQ